MNHINKVYLTTFFLFFLTNTFAIDETHENIKIREGTRAIIKPRPLKNLSSLIVNEGVTNDCIINNIGDFYNVNSAIKNAIRDSIENSPKIYELVGMLGGGFYPGIDGVHSPEIRKIRKVTLWQTIGCDVDLTFDNAFLYAKTYNEKILELLEKE